MAYALVVPVSFLRRAKKFLRSHLERTNQVKNVLLDLEQDPFQQHLRLHPLKGRLEGYYAVSITHSYHIILTLQITEQEIALIDIGGHDTVYR